MTSSPLRILASLSRWLVLLPGLAALTVAAADLQPFTAKSVDEIRRANTGKPFVLAFWSLNCGPCKEEMAFLKSIHGQHPDLPIVLVSTDPPKMRDAIARFLAQHKLGRIQTWSFADDFDERVRFAVDRRWRGELPRTYFFDAEHRSTGQSGLLDAKWVEAWLAREVSRREK